MKAAFRVIDLNKSVQEQQRRKRDRQIDWSLCVVCQKNTDEGLIEPCRNKRPKKEEGIEALSRNLKAFQQLGSVPRNADVETLDSGPGIVKNLIDNSGKWHKSCYVLCNDRQLKRVSDKASAENTPPHLQSPLLTRNSSGVLQTLEKQEPTCLFCNTKSTRASPLIKLSADGEKKVRNVAVNKGDSKVLVFLEGWQGLKGVWYHKNHYTNYVREKNETSLKNCVGTEMAHSEALSSVVSHIQEVKENSTDLPVFIMADLARLYGSKLEKHGIASLVHSSRLKEKLLIECPFLESCGTAGQNSLITYKKDLDTSLRASCSKSFNEYFFLDEAADLLREAIFKHTFVDWEKMSAECNEACTPPLVKYFVKRLLDGPSNVQDDQVVSTLTQLICFNARKKPKMQVRRHDASRETPMPVYLAAKLYGATRSKDLIQTTSGLGLCISYYRLKSILLERSNKACEQYKKEGVVCPVTLERGVFTTAAVDNLDHNTSSTTTKSAFHGTAISLNQHGPAGIARERVNTPENMKRKLIGLPASYTVAPVSFLDGKSATCPTSNLSRVDSLTCDPLNEERTWLESCCDSSTLNTWPAFHSRRNSENVSELMRSAVLPVFREQSQSMAMMSHSMHVVMEATKLLNPSQVPVLTADLPLYIMCKQKQWLSPETFGEKKIFIMMGGMHIEKAAMTSLGDLLEGSGWSTALVQAEITTKGRAESMVSVSHITRTRYAHQVTAAVLHHLKRKAYEKYAGDDPLSFEQWCEQKRCIPMFRYWDIVLNMELAILQLVRSTRTGDLELYIQALSRIAPFFFAMDHQNYARWLPVHIRDLLNLPGLHPELYAEFKAKKFVAAKSSKRFSRISLDQAHEQVNAILKGNGGMIGLTENPSALLKWMLFAPEVAEITENFEQNIFGTYTNSDDAHHFDTESARKLFLKDKLALQEYFESAGNPFAEDSQADLYNIDTRRCCSDEAKASVMRIEELGSEQYLTFTKERLEQGIVSIYQPIKKNRLVIFGQYKKATDKSKAKEQIQALKKESWMFGRLYVGISNNRPGNLNDFFSGESDEFPPALFYNNGKMRPSVKADLLNKCLAPLVDITNKCPAVTAKILDGGAVIHMLKPGLSVVFSDFIQKVFIPFIKGESKYVTRLDIVWDRYIENSLKAATREKRGNGDRVLVALDTKMPQNWMNFLRNSDNKTELFELLANSVAGCHTESGSHLYSTAGTAVVTNAHGVDLTSMSPCNHEEADTRIFLHVADAVRLGHTNILITSSDGDVIVLAVSCVSRLPTLKELWVHVATGGRHRYVPAHEINAALGPDKARALVAFLALTGNDNNSGFFGFGKKKWWDALLLHPEAMHSLIKLGEGDVAGAKQGLERLVMAVYCPTKQFQSITECRRTLFASGNRSLDSIPPTEDALYQHFLRVSLQAQVWNQMLDRMQIIPSPSDWGWKAGTSGWEPVYRTKPTALEACKNVLTHCNCKVACKGNCSCKNIGCCELCGCKCPKK